MRRTLILVFVSILSLPHPADAGGNWIEWNRPHFLHGERVEGLAGIFQRRDLALHAPYFAYLMPDRKGDDWPEGPTLPKDARIVAPVQLIGPGPLRDGLPVEARAFVTFQAPTEPGSYYVSLCNDPCTHQLGDVMATPLRVFASEVEARLVPKIMHLRWQVRRLKKTATEAVSTLEGRIDTQKELRETLSVRLVELDRSLEALRNASRKREANPLLPFIAPALLPLAFLLGRRVKRRATAELHEDVDAELKEMTVIGSPVERDVSRST